MVLGNLDVGRGFVQGEFFANFQPLVVIATGKLYGFELLARWEHGIVGRIPPDEFIPLAEKDGWIGDLTRRLLGEGMRAMVTLPGTPRLAVNISPVQMHDRSLPEQIRILAEESGFALERLVVEITESALMQDIDSARRIVLALKEMGCRLALDDFGTGYSSLSQLQMLPFDELKIDRQFVSSMTEQRESRKIVAAVVGLGQSLGLTTVAEGVETPEQAEMLRWLGCELGQGWLYGRPVAGSELATVSDAMPRDVFHGSAEGREAISRSGLENLPAHRLAQLQAVYDGAPVGLAFLDHNLRYVNLNRTLSKMNGRPIEEHLGRTVEEMVPEIFPHVEKYIRRALQGEAISAVDLTMPSYAREEPHRYALSFEPARDEAGEVIGISVAIVDISPIKRAEEAQQKSEDNLRSMMELLPQIPWVIDDEGRALDVSQRWLEISGMRGDEWRGFGWLKALHPDDVQPTLDAMAHGFKTGEPMDVVYRVRRSEHDAWTAMRSRGSARRDGEGKIVCWYGSMEELKAWSGYLERRERP
jgi:PAS domain S-box-containing protein